MPSTPPPVLENLILMRPFHPIDELSVSKNWLLVNENMVTFDGKQCDKIGVSFSAFQHQSNKCQKRAGTCLGGQIKHLIEADAEREKQNKEPLFRVERKGKFKAQVTTGKINLNMVYEQDMSTSVLLEIDAEDLKYSTTA